MFQNLHQLKILNKFHQHQLIALKKVWLMSHLRHNNRERLGKIRLLPKKIRRSHLSWKKLTLKRNAKMSFLSQRSLNKRNGFRKSLQKILRQINSRSHSFLGMTLAIFPSQTKRPLKREWKLLKSKRTPLLRQKN